MLNASSLYRFIASVAQLCSQLPGQLLVAGEVINSNRVQYLPNSTIYMCVFMIFLPSLGWRTSPSLGRFFPIFPHGALTRIDLWIFCANENRVTAILSVSVGDVNHQSINRSDLPSPRTSMTSRRDDLLLAQERNVVVVFSGLVYSSSWRLEPQN